MITTSKIRKDEQITVRQPTWKQSKDFLRHVNPENASRMTIYKHYTNYINNRPASDRLEIGRNHNSTRLGPALEGFKRGRSLIMAVHNYTCPVCGESYGDHRTHEVRIGKIQFHHIQPLHESGNNDITNIVPLCKHCHEYVHRELNYGVNVLAGVTV